MQAGHSQIEETPQDQIQRYLSNTIDIFTLNRAQLSATFPFLFHNKFEEIVDLFKNDANGPEKIFALSIAYARYNTAN